MIFILVFSVLSLVAHADEQGGLLAWRAPNADELVADPEWRADDPDRYLVARADFDGDGAADLAELVVNVKENAIGVRVVMAASPQAPIIAAREYEKSSASIMGVSVVSPGTYKTACGKGYFQCPAGEPEELHLRLPVIDFFRSGSADSFLVWNSESRVFSRHWMSD